jgi:hypothetical protein
MKLFKRKAITTVSEGSVELPKKQDVAQINSSTGLLESSPLNLAADRLLSLHVMNCISFSAKWGGPEAWFDYRPQFQLEKELHDQFQGMRDATESLRVEKAKEIEKVRIGVKSSVLKSRSALEECDSRQAKRQAAFDRLYSLLENDPSELERFNRNRLLVFGINAVAAIVLTSSEFVLTSSMFIQALRLPNVNQGKILSASVLGLLWLIPHFGAKALKNSMYSNSQNATEDSATKDDGQAWVRSLVNANKALKWMSVTIGCILIILIVPLTVERFRSLILGDTSHASGIYAFWWLTLIFLVQVIIALVFFWLEWMFYGLLSSNALKAKRELNKSIEDRKKALGKYLEDEMRFVARNLALWHVYASFKKQDQLIVTNYERAISSGRSAMVKARPEFETFINMAPSPVLRDISMTAEVQPELLGVVDDAERFAREDLNKFLASKGFRPYEDPFASPKPETSSQTKPSRKKTETKSQQNHEN